MMLLIGGEKGGTGKSTIATNLAAMRAQRGRDVLIVDCDPQGSASYWTSTRDELGVEPRVACIQKFGKSLARELRDLAGRYEDIIIDTGGRDTVELRGAMVIADRLVAPLQASQFDLWTVDQVDKLVSEALALNPGLKAGVLISRAPTSHSWADLRNAREMLAEFEYLSLMRSIIRERVAYRRAPIQGKSVMEMDAKDSRAAAEVSYLHEEIFGG